jgi:hypothetical protein
MMYALGRRLEPSDMPAVRRIIRDASRQEFRMSAFLTGIVDSAAFTMAKRTIDQRTSETARPVAGH